MNARHSSTRSKLGELDEAFCLHSLDGLAVNGSGCFPTPKVLRISAPGWHGAAEPTRGSRGVMNSTSKRLRTCCQCIQNLRNWNNNWDCWSIRFGFDFASVAPPTRAESPAAPGATLHGEPHATDAKTASNKNKQRFYVNSQGATARRRQLEMRTIARSLPSRASVSPIAGLMVVPLTATRSGWATAPI